MQWSRSRSRGSATRPVSLGTSKVIGYSLLGLIHFLIIFLLFIHAPKHSITAIAAVYTNNNEHDQPPQNVHKMSLPEIEDPVIHGISREMLPFTEIKVNNRDLKRMHSGVPPDQLYDFDWEQETPGKETIFISIPSLNDPDCNRTIASAFGEASNPDRIYFGIYEQNKAESGLDCMDFSGVDCPFHPVCSRLEHIHITRVDISESRGPTWGRFNADKLYGGQQFIFISDSHTLFRTYWDRLLLDLWYSTRNDHAIITHYPKPDQSIQNDMHRWYGPANQHPMSYHICGSIFEPAPNFMPRNANGCYAHIKKRQQLQSVLVPFWAAGFSFSKAHLRYLVPFDPHTTFIFHGEEFHFSTRAWTHGYDFYSPPFDIAFHVYYDKQRTSRLNINHVRNAQSNMKRDGAEKRVNALWGLLELRTPDDVEKVDVEDMDQYPLGEKRSLSDYWKFAGIDPVEKTYTVFETKQWSNGGLERVPWRDRLDDPVLNPKLHGSY